MAGDYNFSAASFKFERYTQFHPQIKLLVINFSNLLHIVWYSLVEIRVSYFECFVLCGRYHENLLIARKPIFEFECTNYKKSS